MSKKVEWYVSFVNYNYKPKKKDLIALFYFEPIKGLSTKEVVGRIASESSTGTWTTLFRMPKKMESLKATAFHVKGNLKIFKILNFSHLLISIIKNYG